MMKMKVTVPCLLGAAALNAAALLTISPAHSASSSDSKIYTLDGVVFEGNHRVSTDVLTNVCGLHVGEKVSRQTIIDAFQNVVAEYKKENVGGKIQPELLERGATLKVVFEITEQAPPKAVAVNPILDHETFTGNHKVSSDKLSAVLSLKPGTEVTKELVANELQAILKVYKAAGVGARIEPKVTQLQGAHIDLNFDITEGNGGKAPRDTTDPSD